jgi:hypothetical protein
MIEIRTKKFIDLGDLMVQTPLMGAFGASSRRPVGSQKNSLIFIWWYLK